MFNFISRIVVSTFIVLTKPIVLFIYFYRFVNLEFVNSWGIINKYYINDLVLLYINKN